MTVIHFRDRCRICYMPLRDSYRGRYLRYFYIYKTFRHNGQVLSFKELMSKLLSINLPSNACDDHDSHILCVACSDRLISLESSMKECRDQRFELRSKYAKTSRITNSILLQNKDDSLFVNSIIVSHDDISEENYKSSIESVLSDNSDNRLNEGMNSSSLLFKILSDSQLTVGAKSKTNEKSRKRKPFLPEKRKPTVLFSHQENDSTPTLKHTDEECMEWDNPEIQELNSYAVQPEEQAPLNETKKLSWHSIPFTIDSIESGSLDVKKKSNASNDGESEMQECKACQFNTGETNSLTGNADNSAFLGIKLSIESESQTSEEPAKSAITNFTSAKRNKSRKSCSKLIKEELKSFNSDEFRNVNTNENFFDKDPAEVQNDSSCNKSKLDPRKCEECGKLLFTYKQYILHRQSHARSCKECWICGTETSDVKKHLSTLHSSDYNPSQYQCQQCQTTFNNYANLHAHAAEHYKSKPYECPICLKRFSQQGNLSCHLRIHSGVKPFVCNICSKTFRHSNSLRRHLRTVHSESKSENSMKTEAADDFDHHASEIPPILYSSAIVTSVSHSTFSSPVTTSVTNCSVSGCSPMMMMMVVTDPIEAIPGSISVENSNCTANHANR